MKAYRESKQRKVTPPSPAFMSNDELAGYLSGLRSNRTPRPGGARPPPLPSQTNYTTTTTTTTPARSRYSLDTSSEYSQTTENNTPLSNTRVDASVGSRYSNFGAPAERDYYQHVPVNQAPKSNEVVPTSTYMERGQRWMEKEEVVSLRGAMDEMNLRHGSPIPDDESRIYDAALNEAAELVWQHQHGVPAPQAPEGAYRYRPHLRKNSYAHARAASISNRTSNNTGMNRDIGYRSVSGSSTGSDGYTRTNRPSVESTLQDDMVGSRRKTYGGVLVQSSNSRRRSSKRNISGEMDIPFSGDQIWEEPGPTARRGGPPPHPPVSMAAATVPLITNSQNRFQNNMYTASKPMERIEIHRNPPSRSRNPLYTTSHARSTSPPDTNVETRNGVEIRSQEIRDATGRRLKDRSARLPEPTAVSDSPGRPIVSFDASWRAPEETNNSHHPVAPTAPLNLRRYQEEPSSPSKVPIPSIVVDEDKPQRAPSAMPIPTICVEADEPNPIPTINIPTIAVDDDKTPTISISTASPTKGRPLPVTDKRRAPPKPRGHFSPAPSLPGRARTACHECGFPIEGRFVSLAGTNERFHPQCFSCFCCGTSLEAMEISPEPETVRGARLDRIRRRASGEEVPDEPGASEADDGDDRLRFYCHLDWHEAFAPRCKHCKTPIIGEHVVALGEHWHDGHFFCAECGDPFSHGMTHIEKDGYAWCINCQTKRTERRAPKCRRCKTAVIGEYVEALESEWHEHCFRCADCGGGFADGQIFVREEGNGSVVCTSCRVKELKS